MDSRLAQLGDAVVVALTGPEFAGETITPQRTYGSQIDLTDIKTLVVRVIPGARESERDSRSSFSDLMRIDVGLAKKLTTINDPLTAEFDALLAVAEAVHDFLRVTKLTVGSGAAECVSVTHEPIFSREAFDAHGEFHSVMSVTYRLL